MKRANRKWIQMLKETEFLADEPYKSNTERVNDLYNFGLSAREAAVVAIVEKVMKGMRRNVTGSKQKNQK